MPAFVMGQMYVVSHGVQIIFVEVVYFSIYLKLLHLFCVDNINLTEKTV